MQLAVSANTAQNSYTAELARAVEQERGLDQADFGTAASLQRFNLTFESAAMPLVARSGRVLRAGVDFASEDKLAVAA